MATKGRLSFDIGWIGCIDGKSKVNNKYHLFVDGAHEACGLRAMFELEHILRS